MSNDAKPAWSRGEFEEQLRAKGKGYHIHHPFNLRLNAGACTPRQVRVCTQSCSPPSRVPASLTTSFSLTLRALQREPLPEWQRCACFRRRMDEQKNVLDSVYRSNV